MTWSAENRAWFLSQPHESVILPNGEYRVRIYARNGSGPLVEVRAPTFDEAIRRCRAALPAKTA